MRELANIKGPLVSVVLFRGYDQEKIQEILDGDEYDMISVYATDERLTAVINAGEFISSDYLTLWAMPDAVPDEKLIELFNTNYAEAAV